MCVQCDDLQDLPGSFEDEECPNNLLGGTCSYTHTVKSIREQAHDGDFDSAIIGNNTGFYLSTPHHYLTDKNVVNLDLQN